MSPEDKETPPRHPVAKAAWKGYAEYRAEMIRRRSIPAWREMKLGTMLRIAAILLAVLVVIDLLKN